jgi:hypothetical protein
MVSFENEIKKGNILRELSIFKGFNEIEKALPAREGEIREWKDGKYQYTGGKWRKVKTEGEKKEISNKLSTLEKDKSSILVNMLISGIDRGDINFPTTDGEIEDVINKFMDINFGISHFSKNKKFFYKKTVEFLKPKLERLKHEPEEIKKIRKFKEYKILHDDKSDLSENTQEAQDFYNKNKQIGVGFLNAIKNLTTEERNRLIKLSLNVKDKAIKSGFPIYANIRNYKWGDVIEIVVKHYHDNPEDSRELEFVNNLEYKKERGVKITDKLEFDVTTGSWDGDWDENTISIYKYFDIIE